MRMSGFRYGFFAVMTAAAIAVTVSGCSKTAVKTAETNGQETGTDAAEIAASGIQEVNKDQGGEAVKIGVLQLIQHPALDKANQGFTDAIRDSKLHAVIDQQNASGEQPACQTIAEKFADDNDNLIYAIATPAAQAAAAATTEIPIVISAVTDPAGSGLVASNDAPGGNVTGTSDLTPVKEQIDLLRKLLPSAKKVGILYCTAESNSAIQVKMAKEACDAAGLEAKEYSVSSSNEIQTVVESMIGNADVIYTPTDNTIAAGMSTVSSVATDHKIPIICGEEGQLEGGGLATYGIDYYQLGYMAGEQAVSILRDGRKPADIPIGYLSADKCKLSVNQDAADELGIDTSVLK